SRFRLSSSSSILDLQKKISEKQRGYLGLTTGSRSLVGGKDREISPYSEQAS
ncbi:hypothetical protein LINPERPRIM_LOCUS29284, partial [Linum perenne]